MSIWPETLDRLTMCPPARTLVTAIAVYLFEILFSVWTVAYNFVPGGVYTREHTDYLVALVIGLLGLGVISNRGKYHYHSTPLPFCTTTILHHYHSIPLPFYTITIRHHYHSTPLPFCTITILYHYHSVPLPFCTTTILHHYHSIPLSFYTITILHHYHSVPLPFYTITILNLYNSIPLPFYTITILHHYHSVPLPFYTITILYHYHYVSLPFYTITILHHYHSTPLPFYTITILHHYRSTPFPFYTISILHHYHSTPLPIYTITILHHYHSTPLPFYTITILHHYYSIQLPFLLVLQHQRETKFFDYLGVIIVYKEKELIILLYKTIVRPHLEYCIQAWRPYHKRDIDMLERVQRRPTKIIQELRDISCEMCLNEYGLTTLETRRLRGDQIEVITFIERYERIDRNICSLLRKREGLEDMELY